MKKKLAAYKGVLTPAQVVEGINAARINAKRLLEDAIMLLQSNRFPSAASLAILAIEEAGKVSILRQLSLAKDGSSAEETWRDYRSHTRKNILWLLPQLVSGGARKLDDFKPLFCEDSEHPFLLDTVKQIGFYTDCLGNAHWSIPSDVVDEKLAKVLVNVAQILASRGTTTVKEIELWIKHIGPVWKRNPVWMKKALSNWYRDMQQAGLVPEGENEMGLFAEVLPPSEKR